MEAIKATSKVEKITRHMKRKILSGKFVYGERLPSSAALASKFKVNKETVNRSMAFLAAEGLVERQHGRGTFARYSKEKAEIASSEQDSLNIGIFILGLGLDFDQQHSPSHYSLVHGLINVADNSGCTVTFLGKKGYEPDLETLKRLPVKGVVLTGAETEECGRLANMLSEIGTPYLLVDRIEDDERTNTLSPYGAGEILAKLERFVLEGHKRLVAIQYDVENSRRSPEIMAASDKLAEKLDSSSRIDAFQISDLSSSTFVNMLEPLFAASKHPTLIVASRKCLDGLIAFLADRKLSVPNDVSVVLVGDRVEKRGETRYAAILGEASQKIGETAGKLILNIIGGKTLVPVHNEMSLSFQSGDSYIPINGGSRDGAISNSTPG